MRRIRIASSLLLALCAAGCAAAPAVVPVPAAATAPRAHAASLTPTAPALLLEIAITSLRLDSARRAELEQIEARLETAMAAVRAARAELLETIADGLESGRLDTRAIAERLARVEAAMRAAGPTLAATLEELHARLTPEQRARVMTIARERWREWHDRWRVLDDEASHQALGGADDRFRRTLSQSFAGDAFEVTATDIADDASEDARESGERTAAAAARSLVRLAPSERIELAIRLRERAAAAR